MVEEHIDDPHPKKALRQMAFRNALEEGKLEQSDSTWTRKYVIGKLKKMEKAKYVIDPTRGKLPRMIFDIGVLGSLVGSELLSRFKEAMAAETFIYKSARIRFIKSPDPFTLRDVFRELHTSPYALDFICFSDDAGFAIKINGTIKYVLTDISSADASYTPALFYLLKSLLPLHTHAVVDRLIAQCMLPMKIRDCNNRKKHVILRPLVPVLYSGSTLTTAINTLANFLIAIAIADALEAGTLHTAADITLAVRNAGFLITTKLCDSFEDFQFLKHSPVLDTAGHWQPMLNIGVLLRAYGMCFGDLPGKGPLIPRALAFQRGLVQGAYPYATCSIIDAIWRAVGSGPSFSEAIKEFDYKVVGTDNFPPYRADETSFRRRYSLTDVEVAYLVELLERFPVGHAFNTSAINKICIIDYDLPTTTYTPPEFHHLCPCA